LRIRLPLPPNFSFDAVVRSHGWYDLPPFAYDEHARTLTTRLRSGAVAFQERDGALEATASGRGVARAEITRAARRVFSLDLDLAACSRVFAGEPVLARGLARGGGRMLRAPSLFEDAVKMLFTTNCSWAATRGMVVRLIGFAGDGSGAFPTPAEIARIPPARLKSRVRCGYRALALSRFARRVDSGRLDLSGWERPEASSADVRDAILAEHGFGPYAAEGLLRVLGRHPAERRALPFGCLGHWVLSMIRTSTGALSANVRASCSVPRCDPQCMGTATRGWMRRAASAASCAVMT